MPNAYVMLASSVALGVGGQLFFKQAALSGHGLASLVSWTAGCGILLYGISTVLYLLALQKIPISIAMPSLALGYLLVSICGWTIWREPFSLVQLCGLLLIIIGVLCVNVPGSRPI
jgi:multidrug transporter EmrE-like cation transporter